MTAPSALRQALHMYAVVDDALQQDVPPKEWPKFVPGPALATHSCTARDCRFVRVSEELFVCLFSCHLHHCTDATCDRLQETSDGLICAISGFSFDSRPLLVAGTFVAFGRQQQLSASGTAVEQLPDASNNAVASTSELMETTMTAELDAMPIEASGSGGGEGLAQSSLDTDLEMVRDNPFDSARERALAKKQRDHRAHDRQCQELLQLLLFSDYREKLNTRADKHTWSKHHKALSNYSRKQKTDFVVMKHVWHIISMDCAESTWCFKLPERDGVGHRECQRVCEQACVWWNRFISDNDGKPLSNYTFMYHVLAVLYIYASGMSLEGRPILKHSPVLLFTLPGVETLRNFPGMMPGYYTNHERECRNHIITWVTRHSRPHDE